MTCEQLRRALQESDPEELTQEQWAEIDLHASGCERCRAFVDEWRSCEESMTLLLGLVSQEALSPAQPAASLPQTPAVAALGWNWRTALGTGGLFLGFGAVLGGLAAVTILTPQVRAGPFNELLDVPFFNEAFVSGAGFIESFEEGLEEWDKRGIGPNHAYLDPSVSHTGRYSLRLLHRNYGGGIRKEFRTPIPANSTVRFGAWIRSPRGGSPSNKWLSLGLSVGATSAGHDVMLVDGRWQPITFTLQVDEPTDRLRVDLTTQAGHGQYTGTDWASWIDDVRLYLTSNPSHWEWRVEGDRITVRMELPEPYEPTSVSLSEIYLRAVPQSVPYLRSSRSYIEGRQVVAEFVSERHVSFLRTDKAGSSDSPSLDVVMAAREGDLPCIFGAGVRGFSGFRSP
ncbi:MAG: hypothetical protein DCC46_09835 [Armatimonadetes bacterium]|nr:MAG: hypothetical protein DCC46_09835 [Armatimonadota bacterium]